MPEHSAGTDASDKPSGALSGRLSTSPRKPSRARRVALFIVAAVVCYSLTLSIASDSLFFLGIPGFIGLTVLVVIAVGSTMTPNPRASRIPHIADGSDVDSAVKYQYAALLKRYFSILAISAAMIITVVTVDTIYLFPCVGMAIIATVVGTRFWIQQNSLVRRCVKIARGYNFVFRAPVSKFDIRPSGRRFLRMGIEGEDGSPLMSARDAMQRKGWPEAIEDGVWFGGDDAFGGVLLVPGSGELMCMQPRDWEELAPERERADPERIQKAKRAGLTRHTL